MAVVDTSFLIALVDETDRFHDDAARTELVGPHLLVPGEVWIEFCQWVMRFVHGRPARDLLESLLSGPFDIRAPLDAQGLARAALAAETHQARLAKAGHKPLSLFDVVVCETAMRQHESVLTFDQGILHAVRSNMFPGARLA